MIFFLRDGEGGPVPLDPPVKTPLMIHTRICDDGVQKVRLFCTLSLDHLTILYFLILFSRTLKMHAVPGIYRNVYKIGRQKQFTRRRKKKQHSNYSRCYTFHFKVTRSTILLGLLVCSTSFFLKHVLWLWFVYIFKKDGMLKSL